MRRIIFLGSALVFVCLVSSCIFSPDDKKDVKQGTVTGKVSMVITGDPLANVKVILVNLDVKVDTVNYANNLKAFVDSAFTNSAGEYVIDNVAPGNYGVVAFLEDSTTTYKFALDQNSGSGQFTMNGETRTVNFIAEKTNLPGAVGSNIRFIIFIKHRGFMLEDIVVQRKMWAVFVPFWSDYSSAYMEKAGNNQNMVLFDATAGYTTVVVTYDNRFKFTMTEGRSFEIGFPLSSTPGESTWDFDYDTQVLTQR